MLQQSTLSVNLARFIRGENVDVLTELEDGWETHYMRRKFINYQCLEFSLEWVRAIDGDEGVEGVGHHVDCSQGRCCGVGLGVCAQVRGLEMLRLGFR